MGIFDKIRKLNEAWSAGDYNEFGRLFWEAVGELAGWTGRQAQVEGNELSACITELEVLEQNVRAGGARAAGPWLTLIITVLPVIIEILKNRRDGNIPA